MTDCPTCGRTIRVPELDGKIAPLPKLKLDYADSGLAKALDELASLGATDVLAAVAKDSSLPKPEVVIPIPLPVVEAVSLPVPLPPDPMPQSGPSQPAVLPISQTIPVSQESKSHWGALEELAAIPTRSRTEAAAIPQTKLSPLIAGIVCGVVGLLGGLWMGRLSVGTSEPVNQPAVVERPAEPPPVVRPAVDPAVEQKTVPPSGPPAADWKRAIEGRITFINSEGESRPDGDARILVVPATREGTTKLAVDSFRAGTSGADLLLAQASIRALGGNFVLAGAEGHFEVHLPSTGKFQLFIVSRHQGRGSQSEIDPAEIAVLKDWFDKPPLFFGQTQSTLATVQFDGQNSSIRDHVFPKAE